MGGGNLANQGKKKGFAISGILYPLLILTLFLVVQILMMLETRKNVLDKVRTELAESVNSSNKIYTNEELSILVDEINNNFLNKTYPVGSIYISYTNINPSSLFGGTWTSYGAGRTLVGVDTSQTEFNTIGKTGGEKTHTLTIEEMPKHSHHYNSLGDGNGSVRVNWVDNPSYQTGYSLQYAGAGEKSYLEVDSPYNVGFKERGGNQPHNNFNLI